MTPLPPHSKEKGFTPEDDQGEGMSEIPVCACGEKNIDQCMCSCDGVPAEVRELVNSASGILEVHAISIPLPWDGTLDDLEKERFRGLLTVVNFVREEECKRGKAAARTVLKLVDKALNDISDSEEQAIDSLERARLEILEIVET